VLLDYPTKSEEKRMMDMVEHEENIKVEKVLSISEFEKIKFDIEKVKISDDVKEYITKLVHKTREKDSDIVYGSSPR
jgi:MoxR-like ATPase